MQRLEAQMMVTAWQQVWLSLLSQFSSVVHVRPALMMLPVLVRTNSMYLYMCSKSPVICRDVQPNGSRPHAARALIRAADEIVIHVGMIQIDPDSGSQCTPNASASMHFVFSWEGSPPSRAAIQRHYQHSSRSERLAVESPSRLPLELLSSDCSELSK